MDDLALDGDGDIYLGEDQDIAVVSGADEVGQAAVIRLRSHKGEYALDQAFGPDYINQVLTTPYYKASSENHVRAELLKVDELQSVGSMDLEPDYQGRQVSGNIEIQTIYGKRNVSI